MKKTSNYIEKIRMDYLRMKASLYQKETKLYALPYYYDKIYSDINKFSILGLFIINISIYEKFEKNFSWTILDFIIKNLIESAKSFFNQTKYKTTITSEYPGGNIIIIITPNAKTEKSLFLDQSIIEKISDDLFAYLEKKLSQKLNSNSKNTFVKTPPLSIGYSLLTKQANIRFERSLTYAISQAQTKALGIERIHFNKKIIELKKIIQEKNITTVFQPIVDINSFMPFGYEALSRGPKNTEFHNPELMFEVAEKGHLVWELERLCREKSLYYLQMLEKNQYLFINNEPDVIFDPDFRTLDLLKKFNIDPKRIVLEITERTAIQDFEKFQQALDFFRQKGFKIAIDDVGTGYSNLQSIAILKPDFIKFDISLIRNINNNNIKQHLVSSLVSFVNETGTIMIAEGIETKDELQIIQKFNIPYGQGYYFAHPGQAFPEVIAK